MCSSMLWSMAHDLWRVVARSWSRHEDDLEFNDCQFPCQAVGCWPGCWLFAVCVFWAPLQLRTHQEISSRALDRKWVSVQRGDESLVPRYPLYYRNRTEEVPDDEGG